MAFTQAETTHIASIRPSQLLASDAAAQRAAALIEQRLVQLIRRGAKNLRGPIQKEKALLLAALGKNAGALVKVDAWLLAVTEARAAEQARETLQASASHAKRNRAPQTRVGASFKQRF